MRIGNASDNLKRQWWFSGCAARLLSSCYNGVGNKESFHISFGLFWGRPRKQAGLASPHYVMSTAMILTRSELWEESRVSFQQHEILLIGQTSYEPHTDEHI